MLSDKLYLNFCDVCGRGCQSRSPRRLSCRVGVRQKAAQRRRSAAGTLVRSSTSAVPLITPDNASAAAVAIGKIEELCEIEREIDTEPAEIRRREPLTERFRGRCPT